MKRSLSSTSWIFIAVQSALIAAKLAGWITWSWWLALLPILFVPVFVMGVFLYHLRNQLRQAKWTK